MSEMFKKKRKTLKDQEKIIRFMALPININDQTSHLFYAGTWWKSREKLNDVSKKN